MKSIEHRVRITRTKQIILKSIYAAGVLSVGLIAPNVIGALARMGVLQKLSRNTEFSYRRTLRTMQEQGLVTIYGSGKNTEITLTDKGRVYLQSRDIVTIQKKRWDKKWRILLFDIPESRKAVRDIVRHALTTLGFIQLQKSVWVCPHPCEEIILLLKKEHRLGLSLLYVVADEIEAEERLLKHFNLKR